MLKNLLKAFHGNAPTPQVEAPPAPEAQALIAEGNAEEDAGRLAEARRLYALAVATAPQLPAAHLNLGIALEALGETEPARASYRQVLALAPGHVFGAYNLGKLEYTQGNLREAESLLRQTIAGKIDFHQAWVLLSCVLEALGELPAAAEAIGQALVLQPAHAGALGNQAGIFRKLGRADDCEASLARALALEPHNVDLLGAHAAALVAQGFAADGLAQLRRALALAPQRFDLRSLELYVLNLVDDVPVEVVWQRHLAFGVELEAAVEPRVHTIPRADKPRLRIGFVSGELRHHPVALFLLPLLRHLDRSRFEVACYASNTRNDEITNRVRSVSDRWVDAAGWTDARLQEQILADAIDVLVDLDGHTSQSRLGVFATRPAPLQLTWVGYLNTTGLSRMDWRVTDARCDPPWLSQPLHTERLLLLPHSQWCYSPFIDESPAAAAPCERNGYVTFGSLNNVAKLTPQLARRWGRILHALPRARLVVADASSAKKRQALLDDIKAAGGDPERVRFTPRTGVAAYYRAMDEIDIALDSHPYGGGTATLDALWMGVPVLTAAGRLPASRSASSLLSVLGLQAWIAPDVTHYEALAIERSQDLHAIAALRRNLRDRLRASPLMDEHGFTAAFQDALERAWRERAAAPAQAR